MKIYIFRIILITHNSLYKFNIFISILLKFNFYLLNVMNGVAFQTSVFEHRTQY